jgi:sulfane dehydrogenase subunit SoxC
MEVKSVITRPSPGVALQGPGLYEVSGIAWSGYGTIRQVEVSANGGQTWAAAALSAPVLPRALTRFHIPWKWNGTPAGLKSRATDDSGAVQPTCDALVSAHSTNAIFHYNAIQAWQVESTGEVKNVYA